jgi:hypothetical protein
VWVKVEEGDKRTEKGEERNVRDERRTAKPLPRHLEFRNGNRL